MRLRILTLGFVLAGAVPFSVAQTAASTAPQKPSDLIAPALNKVASAGSSVDLNKWKGNNAMRSDVDANLASIEKDIEKILPDLLQASDAAPSSVAANLRILMNLDALYNVLLRVDLTGKAAAPTPQLTALEDALQSLDHARVQLGARIAADADTQQQQIAQLQTLVQQQKSQIATLQAPPPPPPPAPKPAARKRPVKKKTPAPTGSAPPQ